MSEPARDPELDAFVAAIENEFRTRRGKEHVLSPRDFALARGSHEAGVPLATLLVAIDAAFDHDPSTASLAACRRRVEELAAPAAGRTARDGVISVQNRSTLEQLGRCGEWSGHLAGAALGIAIVTPDPTTKFQTMFDAGQAAAYMQLAAWELGIGSCPASIYDEDNAREILGVPASLHLRVMISFGFPLEAAKLTTAPRKGGRRAFEDVVHMEKW